MNTGLRSPHYNNSGHGSISILKIEGDPEEAIRRILNVRKREGGWPKPEKRTGMNEK